MIIKSIFIPNIKNNITFYIGQNTEENFQIIDNAKQTDLWFHIHQHSSCHVVASIPEKYNKKQLHKIAVQGGLLCKQYSKFKCHSNVNIVYCKVMHVKKTDILGQVEIQHEKYMIL